jgi:hypothetical protein
MGLAPNRQSSRLCPKQQLLIFFQPWCLQSLENWLKIQLLDIQTVNGRPSTLVQETRHE